MSFLDDIYNTVYSCMDNGDFDSDILYRVIDNCFRNAIIYSWTLNDIEYYIKLLNGTDLLPTNEAKKYVLGRIRNRFSSRRYPATEEDVMQMIKDLLAQEKIEFINKNKLIISKGKLSTKISIPEILNLIEMQGDLYDLCEKCGLKLKINKEHKPGEVIFDLKFEGETSALLKVKSLLEKQIKMGATLLPKEKDEIKKQEATE